MLMMMVTGTLSSRKDDVPCSSSAVVCPSIFPIIWNIHCSCLLLLTTCSYRNIEQIIRKGARRAINCFRHIFFVLVEKCCQTCFLPEHGARSGWQILEDGTQCFVVGRGKTRTRGLAKFFSRLGIKQTVPLQIQGPHREQLTRR